MNAGLTRLRCRLFSCVAKSVPGCERCGADLYGGEFVDVGVITDISDRITAIWRKLAPRTCWVCGKRLKRSDKDQFCSAECRDKFIPF